MSFKKSRIIGFIILMMLVSIIIANCGGEDVGPEEALNNFSKLIEEDKIDDLSLKVYYVGENILTYAPLKVEDLTDSDISNKLSVKGEDLKEQIDLLKQFDADVLIPVETESKINARVYYVFERKGRKILDVAMWGRNSSVFVNGIEVKEQNVFYEVILPFLTDEEFKSSLEARLKE